MTIFPTHTCFDDALDFLEALARQNNPMLYRMKVVHGVCTAPDGHDYAHAWVEQDEEFCIFAGFRNGVKEYFAATAKEFYAEHRVRAFTKYTPREAVELNHKHETYGPWEDRYLALCADGGKKVWLQSANVRAASIAKSS